MVLRGTQRAWRKRVPTAPLHPFNQLPHFFKELSIPEPSEIAKKSEAGSPMDFDQEDQKKTSVRVPANATTASFPPEPRGTVPTQIILPAMASESTLRHMQHSIMLPKHTTPGGPPSIAGSQRRTAIRASATKNEVDDVEMDPTAPDTFLPSNTEYQGESEHLV